MITPKSPDTIMEEFEEKFTKENPGWRETGATGELILNTNVPVYIQNFLRSSMSSLLYYMAERMPEHEEGYPDPYSEETDNSSDGFNRAIDDCRTLLIEEAKKLI